MKFLSKMMVLMMILTLTLSGAAFAVSDPPTEGEIIAATDDGMAWLEGMQNADGSWGASDRIGRTGLALLKFETHALNDPALNGPLDPAYEYVTNVEAGLNYLFSQAEIHAEGIRFDGGLHHETYSTSIALMAIVASGASDFPPVTVGPAIGMTYKQVAQDIVDYLAYSQNSVGWTRGGWGYDATDTDWSDNSISGYATMGLAFAEHPDYGFDCTIPASVKTELEIWINYIQSPDGGSGYTGPGSWENLLKTGNLLQQLAFIGVNKDDARVVAAIGYIETNWNVANWDPGWKGVSVADYQATFALMKGLHGLDIDLLDLDSGVGDLDDWFDDVAYDLLTQQNADYSWPNTNWDGDGTRVLSTTWALLTLQKVAPRHIENIGIEVKPKSHPKSVNLRAKGVLPVAILGAAAFDVAEVDPATVLLTKPGSDVELPPLRWAMEDVNDDGVVDMILHFDLGEIAALLLDPGDEEVELIGETVGGTPIYGMDIIRTVPQD